MHMMERKFECNRDGLTIRGTEYRLAGERLPIAIVSHGFMDSQNGVKRYAQQLAQWGYAAYCFDFCGGCLKGTSDGATTDMTVYTEKEDLKAVISYVKSLPYVDPSRLILMGCSQGGFVSALTAAELREQVEKLILFYPALCIPDDARRGQMMMAKFDPQNIPEMIKCGPFRMGRNYPACVLSVDSFEEIKTYHGPVLIIHGTNDKIVAPHYAQKAQKAYCDCDLAMIEGAGHGFRGRTDKLAMDMVSQFLQGRRNILTVDVTLTGHHLEKKGAYSTLTLPFTGKAISPWFQGEIQPGAADVQKRYLWKTVHFCADYIIKGADYTGAPCTVHIVNEDTGSGWKPTVTTDSEALSFLNGADCTAILENRKQGPIVRIYCERPACPHGHFLSVPYPHR